ncbi:cilia- and flagella-associated protein 97-like [Halichondria panicea]|uniref:cilia- and flagella-associated protein 97-like n=1 Tax=Halichondria panicea TaxID=6063 RepID=UPI00312B7767
MASCNRLLQKKWEDKKFRDHRDRLRKIKSSVDNGYPQEFVHIRENKKKQKIEQDRQATIQRHNNQLLKRMHTIMQTTGGVDHRNTDWRPKKSLNTVKRQREMDRISRENHGLLRRLETIQPQYSTRKWEEDFLEHQSRAKSMQLFPSLQEGRMLVEGPKLRSDVPILPPIVTTGSSRPETQPMSEIKEEIDVDD